MGKNKRKALKSKKGDVAEKEAAASRPGNKPGRKKVRDFNLTFHCAP